MVCTNNLLLLLRSPIICSIPSVLTLISCPWFFPAPTRIRCPEVKTYESLCASLQHNLSQPLAYSAPTPPTKPPSKWEQHVVGNIVRECTRHSKIFFHSEETTGQGLRWTGLCGCGPGFVRSLSEATSEPWALCNAIWMGRGGFPLGFRRTATEVQCRDGWSMMSGSAR